MTYKSHKDFVQKLLQDYSQNIIQHKLSWLYGSFVHLEWE